MLPATQNLNPPSNSGVTAANRWRLILVIGSMVYTFLLGLGLLARVVPPERAYVLMAVLCLVPAGWYAYGFWRVEDRLQDVGLLISAVGWVLVALAFIIKYSFTISDLKAAADLSATPTGKSPAALVCAIVALCCLLVGAVISWRGWAREIQAGHGIAD